MPSTMLEEIARLLRLRDMGGIVARRWCSITSNIFSKDFVPPREISKEIFQLTGIVISMN